MQWFFFELFWLLLDCSMPLGTCQLQTSLLVKLP
jgi:hypothetical protein